MRLILSLKLNNKDTEKGTPPPCSVISGPIEGQIHHPLTLPCGPKTGSGTTEFSYIF
jgi:hypothetical protein